MKQNIAARSNRVSDLFSSNIRNFKTNRQTYKLYFINDKYKQTFERAFQEFGAKSDKKLAKSLEHGAKNANYQYGTSENKIVFIIRNLYKKRFLKKFELFNFLR